MVNVKDPKKIKYEDLLLKFKSKDEPERLETVEEAQQRVEMSKSFWTAFVGGVGNAS